ncbi:hypothetical protein VPH35_091961 [Triticum aestivum]
MAMEDVEWQWQSLPLLLRVYQRRRQPSTPPFGACWRYEMHFVHLIAKIFVEAASLINQPIPPMLFQYLKCFCFNCVFALTFSTSSRTECQLPSILDIHNCC